MLTVFIIALREFLEAFLIIGVFLGISRNLKLKREKEIVLASGTGILISLFLPIIVFLIGEKARSILTEKNTELLEGYIMIFSGFFIAYVIFSLHDVISRSRSKSLQASKNRLVRNIFDVTLFTTIILFILREGIEIALFTAAASLFSTFAQNLTGLLLGFAGSSLFGFLAYFAYARFPIAKVYKLTEYTIILLGASLVKNGLGELLEIYFDIHLSRIIPLQLSFLPDKSTMVGHMLNSITGIEQHFSVAKLGIMALYIFFIYILFLKNHSRSSV